MMTLDTLTSYHQDRADAYAQVTALREVGVGGVVGTHHQEHPTLPGLDVWLVVVPGQVLSVALTAQEAHDELRARQRRRMEAPNV